MRQVIRHARTILDVYALRLVDEHAHESAPRGRVPVDQLVTHRRQRTLQNLTQLHALQPAQRKKKWARQPISYASRGSIIARMPASLKCRRGAQRRRPRAAGPAGGTLACGGGPIRARLHPGEPYENASATTRETNGVHSDRQRLVAGLRAGWMQRECRTYAAA